jgi:2-polyprenyl-3-methyl-5-hydroxy-6-metoxy-1,4-benzoquinol methylase
MRSQTEGVGSGGHEQLHEELQFTGERIVPGKTVEELFREHEIRYQFAGSYVEGKDVLDIACGTGIGTDYLRRQGARTSSGLDIDGEAVRYANLNYRYCRFAECDASQIPISDNSMDVVVSFETIEHLPDSVKFLVECKRVLRPGGLLICSTPNHTVYRWYGKNPFHTREFAVEEFIGLLGSLFGKTDIYTQTEKFYPIFAPGATVLRLLRKARLQSNSLESGTRATSALVQRTHFDPPMSGAIPGLQPYVRKLLRKPLYIIGLAQKGIA